MLIHEHIEEGFGVSLWQYGKNFLVWLEKKKKKKNTNAVPKFSIPVVIFMNIHEFSRCVMVSDHGCHGQASIFLPPDRLGVMWRDSSRLTALIGMKWQHAGLVASRLYYTLINTIWAPLWSWHATSMKVKMIDTFRVDLCECHFGRI